MTDMPASRSALAYLRGPNNTRNLVLTRNYGAIIAVVLDDKDFNENAIMRIPVLHVAQFIDPFCDDIVIPDMADQYDAVQLYLSDNNLPMIGPLSTARAALAVKAGMEPQAAIDSAINEGSDLTNQQAKRAAMAEATTAACGH